MAPAIGLNGLTDQLSIRVGHYPAAGIGQDHLIAADVSQLLDQRLDTCPGLSLVVSVGQEQAKMLRLPGIATQDVAMEFSGRRATGK